MSQDSWYNSKFFGRLGAGLGIAAVIAAFGYGCLKNRGPSYAELQVEMERVRRGYVLQTQDLNEDGKPERFIEVDGTKYFLEIGGDGKTLERILTERTR